MSSEIDAILIHGKDNVITAITVLKAGSTARFEQNGEIATVRVTEEIPQYHKIAIEDIQLSKPVYKYGELIGEAVKPIKAGNHVHDHNITSPKKIGADRSEI